MVSQQDVIYEKLNITIDIDRLRHQFEHQIMNLEPEMQSSSFGGWSVLSATGSYRDGWAQGHRAYRQVNGRDVVDFERAKQVGILPTLAYSKATEICTDYVAEIIQIINSMGLNARRARFSVLKANSQSSYHRDAPDQGYAVRLHIPIITNPNCVFRCELGEAHMPADGSLYLVRVNRMHQVINRSPYDRVHLFMDVYDTRGVSQYHRLDANVIFKMKSDDKNSVDLL